MKKNKIADRMRLSLEKASLVAKEAEYDIDHVHTSLVNLIDKLSDIELTIFNAWVFLIAPENMADALRHISRTDLEECFNKCTDETLQKIRIALRQSDK